MFFTCAPSGGFYRGAGIEQALDGVGRASRRRCDRQRAVTRPGSAGEQDLNLFRIGGGHHEKRRSLFGLAVRVETLIEQRRLVPEEFRRVRYAPKSARFHRLSITGLVVGTAVGRAVRSAITAQELPA